MIKNITQLEHKIGDRVYHFTCENDSPLGECHDAIMAFKDCVIHRIKDVHESQKPEKKDE